MAEPGKGRTVFLEDGAAAPYAEARVAVLPVAFEATVSYGRGAARAPRAILEASAQLELYDEQLAAEPYRCGVWTAPTLDPGRVSAERAAEQAGRAAGRLLDDGRWLLALGGEHSLTPGIVRAAAARHPGLRVVQLDAHADLRESYDGDRWSHACAMARCLEVAPVRALGVRSYSAEEAERIRAGIPGYRITHAWEMRRDGGSEPALDGLADRPVYLTIDVDYFDPSVVPATGTPEPGGAEWQPTLRLLERLFRTSRVVGCDIVELAPIPGLHHADYTVARLAYKLIGYACGCGVGDASR